MPVKKLDLQEESDRTFLERCGLSDPFKFSPQWQEQQQNFFTNPFRLARLKDYIVTDTNLFFPTIHRIRFVWEIICNKLALEPSDWSDQQSEPLCNYQVGIMWLIDNDIYSAAFPLHTGECEKVDSAEVPSKISPRKWLYHTWGSWGAWRYYQPLDKIKEYFGEKVSQRSKAIRLQ